MKQFGIKDKLDNTDFKDWRTYVPFKQTKAGEERQSEVDESITNADIYHRGNKIFTVKNLIAALVTALAVNSCSDSNKQLEKESVETRNQLTQLLACMPTKNPEVKKLQKEIQSFCDSQQSDAIEKFKPTYSSAKN